MTEDISPAAPLVDQDSKFFWEALREDRVVLQVCHECGRHRFPPMPRCPYCQAAAASAHQIAGAGTIYSWIIAQRAFAPEFAADVPYTVATVDFDEGVRIALRLEDATGIDFGRRVSTFIKHHADWSELRVRLEN